MHLLKPLQPHHPSFISGRVIDRVQLSQAMRELAATVPIVNWLYRMQGPPQKSREHRQVQGCKSRLQQNPIAHGRPTLFSTSKHHILVQTPPALLLTGHYVGYFSLLQCNKRYDNLRVKNNKKKIKKLSSWVHEIQFISKPFFFFFF